MSDDEFVQFDGDGLDEQATVLAECTIPQQRNTALEALEEDGDDDRA
jgi:hypothetical protein